MEKIRELEKENAMFRAREKFFIYALFLSWCLILLVVCVALIK
jgi:hypothetical protein